MMENITSGLMVNTKLKKKINIKRILFILSLIIIPLLNFLIFYVYVNFDSIMMAFKINVKGVDVYSLENFRMLIREFQLPNSIINESLRNTLITFSVTLLIILPMTVMIAYFLYKKILFNKFFKIIFFLPSILSAVVLTRLYMAMVDRGGPVSNFFQFLFNLPQSPKLLSEVRWSMVGILLYCIWTGFGVNLILFNGALNRIPMEIIEAAKLDGVGMLRELTTVILPLIWPTFSTVLLLSFVGIFTASGPVLLLTDGNSRTSTISFWIFKQVYGTNAGRYEYASAVGIFFTLIALPIVFGVRYIVNKFCTDIEY